MTVLVRRDPHGVNVPDRVMTIVIILKVSQCNNWLVGDEHIAHITGASKKEIVASTAGESATKRYHLKWGF